MCCQAGLLVVPVGGGPPASRPRRELRSARRLEARPGPATAHGHRSQALRYPSRRWPLLCEIPEWFPSNVACNSPASISNIEFRTLELQRFRAVSKNDRGKLRATFVWGQSVHRSAARPSGALHAGAAWCCALPVAPLVFCLACGAAGVPGVGGLFCVRYRSGSRAMSHVIPLQVFQTLNSERWNCNVFGRSRQMTEGNYVRLLW